jgi:hypothetical protein
LRWSLHVIEHAQGVAGKADFLFIIIIAVSQVLSPETVASYGDLVEKEARIWSLLGAHRHLAQLKETYAGPQGVFFVSGESACLLT